MWSRHEHSGRKPFCSLQRNLCFSRNLESLLQSPSVYSLLTTGRRLIPLKFSGTLGSDALDLGIRQIIAFLHSEGMMAEERHVLNNEVKTLVETSFFKHSYTRASRPGAFPNFAAEISFCTSSCVKSLFNSTRSGGTSSCSRLALDSFMTFNS